MTQLYLPPTSDVNGSVNIPGSKSISNRALLLAALAEGKTRLTNLLDADDTRYMIAALNQLGVTTHLSENNTVCEVEGLAGRFDCDSKINLFLGNAGTAMRPLCAALAFSKGTYSLTGEPRMEERPIGDLVDALRQLGVNICYTKQDGFPPVDITSANIRGGHVKIAGNLSSQYLTALLMSAPLVDEKVSIEIIGKLVSKPYIDITLALMSCFGVKVENHNYQQFVIQAGQKYRSPGDYLVEGDASSASYFLAAGAIAGGSVKVTGVGKNSIQGDIEFARILELMGAKIEWGNDYIKATKNNLNGIDVDLNLIPDAAMTIAVAALFAKGPTRIRNIYNWRIKETDRLAAMAKELSKVGAVIEEGEDFIYILPPKQLETANIDTYNDHRMAMCFSLLTFSDKGIRINNPECTAKTFPQYFEKFSKLCGHQENTSN